MKIERKIHLFHFVVNGSLLLSIVLSGILAYFLFSHYTCDMSTFYQFLIAVLNILVLIHVFVARTVLVKEIVRELSSGTKHIDDLTGFMSRHAFGEVFGHVMLDTKRTMEPLCVLLVDIDHFRCINEEYGHRVGDEFISMLSSSIQSVLRASDLTCRWQGDQMLVVLKNCTERNGCRLAEKMLEKISAQELQRQGETISMTASIGVSQMIPGDDMDSLVTRTETGLCSARDNKRGSYAVGYDWILIDYACKPIF